ncbi:CBASS cGAMP-activated phospholipase [Halomonas citrativorans]|uniref:CGAMP-activated phospholipase CapV n=1 Tax=Halomonas citrativorans TaxID=2742612 RepID=A0ABR9FGL0_9GAMM|nr:CBASS cGAMP-activated phospholipase [Halomonas citrativorans]MBE0405246.1 cGAMP-activated phospholipase CapV [Halomonas citrativorans]
MSAHSGDVKILSLNGGGARGLFTINVLAEIERIIEQQTGQSHVKAGEYFDLITGTSIGGILALGLAAGKSARELESVFRDQASLIFPHRRSWRKKWRAVFGAQYNSKPLLEAVACMIGAETTFGDLNRRVMIPAVNLSTGKPQFFKTPHNPSFNRDARLTLLDAAMATSAAPTYFAPHYCADLDAYFADGGLVANNPSFIGLHEVFRDMTCDFPNATVADVKILNIGTLGEEYTVSPAALAAKYNNGYLGLWGFGERLVLTTMTANQQLHKAMLERELSTHNALDNYVYLDDIVPNEAASDITLDNASESSLRNLASRGKQLATTEFTKNSRLQAFFNQPSAPFGSSRRAPAPQETKK